MSFLTMDLSVRYSLAALYLILVCASLIIWLLKKRSPGKNFGELEQRVRSWWVMVTIFALALILSKNVSLLFFALISTLALREFLTIVPTRQSDGLIRLCAYLAIPVQFYWVYIQWYGMFIIFIPVYLFLFLPACMVVIGNTKDFLRAAGTMHWGLVAMVFSVSHVAFLLVLPALESSKAWGAGLVLYLVFLTQFNDVLQFIWGKMLGKHKITPKVSPNKTWEGFLGGVGTTTVLAVLLAPVLTPLTPVQALAAGLLISVAGFIGDVTISALKRDIGVKDSGNLLPGHGGILDRIDSLTYTGPLFFHFVYYFCY